MPVRQHVFLLLFRLPDCRVKKKLGWSLLQKNQCKAVNWTYTRSFRPSEIAWEVLIPVLTLLCVMMVGESVFSQFVVRMTKHLGWSCCVCKHERLMDWFPFIIVPCPVSSWSSQVRTDVKRENDASSPGPPISTGKPHWPQTETNGDVTSVSGKPWTSEYRRNEIRMCSETTSN